MLMASALFEAVPARSRRAQDARLCLQALLGNLVPQEEVQERARQFALAAASSLVDTLSRC